MASLHFGRLSVSRGLIGVAGRHGVLVFLVGLAAGAVATAQTAGSIVTEPLSLGGPTVVDASGNLYQAWYTGPGNQYASTPGAAQAQPAAGICLDTGGGSFLGPPITVSPEPCQAVFLTKVDAAGNTVWASYLGGQTNDYPSAVAIDAAGSLYLAGLTGGLFPVTPNAALAAIPASGAYAAKLSADGSRVVYATYLPLSNAEGEALDAQGNAYVTGKAADGHVGIVKLSADGSTFLYSRELAGSGQEAAYAIAVDAAGNATVTGFTTSADFPVSAGAFQAHLQGPQNAFVTKLDANGNTVFSTYLGGSGSETASTVKSDSAGNIYVAGSTTSTNFPTTAGAFQPAPLAPMWGTSPGGFVAKLAPDGKSLVYASYVPSMGGVGVLALNSQGEAYLSGGTAAGFPVTASAPQPCFGGLTDLFVAHLNSQGALVDATYFGGPGNDTASTLAVAADGSVTLVAAETSLADVRNIVLAKIVFGGQGWTAPACLSADVLNAATLFDPGRVAPGQVSTLTGWGIGPQTGVAYQPGALGQAPLSLAGVQVFFDDQPAPVIYAQSQQVNVIAPFELSALTPNGPLGTLPTTSVRLVYNGTPFGPFTVPVFPGNTAFFRLQPGVSTQAAAINQDGTINGLAHPAPVGSVVSLFGTGFGQTNPSCATGALNAPAAANLVTGTTVTINGPEAVPQVEYAGGAPTLLCGVVQVNIVVPAQTPPGPFQVVPWWELVVGGDSTGTESQIGATIVVK